MPRIGLGVGLIGQAALDHTPVIKDARDVVDLLRPQPGDATQSEIVILRALEPFAEPADLAQQRSAINAKVIEVVLRQEKLGVPVRFKERVGTDALRIEKIFVRIEDGGVPISCNLAGHLRERVFRQLIVLIQERAPIAAGERQGGI